MTIALSRPTRDGQIGGPQHSCQGGGGPASRPPRGPCVFAGPALQFADSAISVPLRERAVLAQVVALRSPLWADITAVSKRAIELRVHGRGWIWRGQALGMAPACQWAGQKSPTPTRPSLHTFDVRFLCGTRVRRLSCHRPAAGGCGRRQGGTLACGAPRQLRRPPPPTDYRERITRQFDERAAGYDDDTSYHGPLALRVVEAASLQPGDTTPAPAMLHLAELSWMARARICLPTWPAAPSAFFAQHLCSRCPS